MEKKREIENKRFAASFGHRDKDLGASVTEGPYSSSEVDYGYQTRSLPLILFYFSSLPAPNCLHSGRTSQNALYSMTEHSQCRLGGST